MVSSLLQHRHTQAKTPTHRDRLEREYLALAKERSNVVEGYDQRLMQMQTQLNKVEMPRHTRTCRPEMDSVIDNVVMLEDEQMEHPESPPPDPAWCSRAASVLALLIGMLRRVATSRNPRLEAWACLFALGVECESMHKVAKTINVTPAGVSWVTKAIQHAFALPKNYHNKTAASVRKYQAIANERARSGRVEAPSGVKDSATFSGQR